MTREDKDRAIQKSSDLLRVEMIKTHAKDGEDLACIAQAFLCQWEAIMVPLLGAQPSATLLRKLADAIESSGDRNIESYMEKR